MDLCSVQGKHAQRLNWTYWFLSKIIFTVNCRTQFFSREVMKFYPVTVAQDEELVGKESKVFLISNQLPTYRKIPALLYCLPFVGNCGFKPFSRILTPSTVNMTLCYILPFSRDEESRKSYNEPALEIRSEI